MEGRRAEPDQDSTDNTTCSLTGVSDKGVEEEEEQDSGPGDAEDTKHPGPIETTTRVSGGRVRWLVGVEEEVEEVGKGRRRLTRQTRGGGPGNAISRQPGG